MRFRIKSGQSAHRFVFDRPQPRGPAEKPISTFCSLCPAHCTAGQREFCFLFLSFYAGVI